MKYITAFIGILIFSAATFSQSSGSGREAFRLDSKKPSVFIAFEKFGLRSERWEGLSGKGMFLRLYNNTKWNLTLSTLGCKTTEEECLVFYDVKRNDTTNTTQKWDVPFGRQRHKSNIMLVPPGKSVLFSVPKEHLQDGLYIAIDFSYEWEMFGDMGGGTLDIIHKATFFSYKLPKEKE